MDNYCTYPHALFLDSPVLSLISKIAFIAVCFKSTNIKAPIMFIRIRKNNNTIIKFFFFYCPDLL